MRVGDLVLGVLLLIGGGALAFASTAYPNLPTQSYGGATFPFAIAVGFMGLGVAMLISHLAASNRDGAGQPLLALTDWGRVPASWVRLVAILVAVPLYLLLSPSLGFLLAGGGLLFALLLIFRTHPLLAALVAPVAVMAMGWLFGTLLRVPLPRSALLQGFW